MFSSSYVYLRWIKNETRDLSMYHQQLVEQYFWYCYEINNRTIVLISSECFPRGFLIGSHS